MTATRVDVVGVTRTGRYPEGLLWLAERVFAADVDPVHAVSLWDTPVESLERCEVRLVREPLNPHDKNAVRVEVPALADADLPVHVGYLPRDVAVRVAPRLDGGEVPACWVRAIPLGSPSGLNHPGLSIYMDWPVP